ncbi:hypothetical protein OQA88_12148 [Cercophora sp. LCS_1]
MPNRPTAQTKTYYSPYGPKPKRSGRLVVLWMMCFLFILFGTWFLTTRHGETTRGMAKTLLLRPDLKVKAQAKEGGD